MYLLVVGRFRVRDRHSTENGVALILGVVGFHIRLEAILRLHPKCSVSLEFVLISDSNPGRYLI